MSELTQTIADGRQSILDLLFADIESGFTFLKTARVTLEAKLVKLSEQLPA